MDEKRRRGRPGRTGLSGIRFEEFEIPAREGIQAGLLEARRKVLEWLTRSQTRNSARLKKCA
jgi:hypothetical protein